MEKNLQHNVQIELTDDTAEGQYANLAVITHSSSEFVIDFISILPGIPKAKVKSRIILTAEHAKRLTIALNDNIKKYETQFGTIELHQTGPIPPPIVGPIGMA